MDLKVNTEKNLLNNTERGLNFPGKVAGETIINGFFSVDQKWNVRYWNKAAEKLLGIKSEDILNKNIWEEFAGVLPLEFYNVYHKAFSQRLPVHFEEYWGEMGTWFDVITYHSEEALHVSFKTCQPKKIERPAQQLAILNELYRLITEVTNDCLWEWDLQLEEIFWIDGGHKRVFGYDIENALIPESFWVGQIHPEDRARVMGKLKKSFVSPDDKMWEDEYRFQKSNGEYAYVHDRGHIVYNEEKKACRIIGATQDISLRKLAEMQLFESEKKLALIAKQTSNALIITDADYKIIWVNNAFVLMSGYKSSEVIGRQMGSFMLGKETLADTLIYLRKKIRDKEPFDCDILNYTKSGNKIWLRIQGQPLLDENGVCFQYFLIETDITERIDMENKLVKERVEREVEITNAVLNAQENERASIGRDLHDNLNQILGAAKMYVELAKTDSVNREVCLEKSSGYIMEVIKEIRHICKNWAAPNQNFISFFDSVKILIEDLIMIHNLKIEFEHDGITEADMDEILQLNLYRIIQEQLNNTLKHGEADQINIHLFKTDSQITLQISDNGKGCDMATIKKGNGIINIKSRALVHNGTVFIESQPGKGFELKVILFNKVTNTK